jgi:peroxiredoxin Q/BCP
MMQPAFNFNLPDKDGNFHKLSDYKGQWVILFIYPRDNTPVCTVEVCSFRDNYQTFKNQNVILLGLSADSKESHQGFSEKHNLNFPILSDESKETIKAYNAWGKKRVYGKEVLGILRRTYLINPEGKIAKIYEKVDPSNNKHSQELLADLHQFQNEMK